MAKAQEQPCRLGIEVPERVRIPGVTFIVFIGSQCYGVYENGRISQRVGKPIYGFAITGAEGFPTPLTDFTRGPDRIEARKLDAVSSEYPIHPDGTRGGARMPYAQFINVARGIAIHEGVLREPFASRGCIRVGPQSARVLFTAFSQNELGVIITQDPGSLTVFWEQGYYAGHSARPQPATRERFNWKNDAGFVIDPDMLWHEEPE